MYGHAGLLHPCVKLADIRDFQDQFDPHAPNERRVGLFPRVRMPEQFVRLQSDYQIVPFKEDIAGIVRKFLEIEGLGVECRGHTQVLHGQVDLELHGRTLDLDLVGPGTAGSELNRIGHLVADLQ